MPCWWLTWPDCGRSPPAQIEEAWADLQQLPTPWNDDGQREQCGVIEFGRIDDSADEPPKPEADRSVEFPSLRVANDFDEVEAELSEVCQQIERIEEPPAKSEEDFQPVGSMQPEIELDFSDSNHPFKEEFEQEEVITDRYAASRRRQVRLCSSRRLPPVGRAENHRQSMPRWIRGSWKEPAHAMP